MSLPILAVEARYVLAGEFIHVRPAVKNITLPLKIDALGINVTSAPMN